MIKDSLDLYNRHILHIVFLGFLLVLPYSLVTLLMIEYVQTSNTIEFGTSMAIFFIILNFSSLFPPFLYLAKSDLVEETPRLLFCLKEFFEKFGIILFLTLLLYSIGILGSIFFFIPTVISLLFIFLLPMFSDSSSVKRIMYSILDTIRKEHIVIVLDIITILCLNYLIWSGAAYLFINFENNSFVYILVRALLNAIFLPFVYFYLINKYRPEWREVS